MDTYFIITIVSVSCAVLIASASLYNAYLTRNFFKKKNIYDQWMVALSADYHKHYYIVKKLIEEAKKDKIGIVEKIDDDENYIKSVEYILDYCITKATAAESKIVDGDLAMRMAYHDIIYLFENLHPWIEKRQKSENIHLYNDLQQFCLNCKKYKEKHKDSKLILL